MSSRFVIGAALVSVLAVAGWSAFGPASSPPPPAAAAARTEASGPAKPVLKPEAEPAEVFRRAFWKRPGPDDYILHAERRELAGAGGSHKWRWFLVLKASPGLLTYLRQENAFGLRPAASPLVPPPEAPAWFSFPENDFKTYGSRTGSMRLSFANDGNLLYATGEGGAFAPGVPEAPAATPVQTETSSGRLPSGPPPSSKPL